MIPAEVSAYMWSIRLRPTWSDLLHNPRGLASFRELSRIAAEPIAEALRKNTLAS